jgi:hypothetical protein
MHRSRVYGIFVDVPRGSAPEAVTFWSAALGTPVRRVSPDDPFMTLVGALPGLAMEVQVVDDEPRYHVDIETDDVTAETERLVALGATEEVRHDGRNVLRAPGGHLLCVVPVQSDSEYFAAHAGTRTWD